MTPNDNEKFDFREDFEMYEEKSPQEIERAIGGCLNIVIVAFFSLILLSALILLIH